MLDLKGLVWRVLFRRWTRRTAVEDGYAILLPSPMDMPFLLRFGLEGITQADTTHCRQILVIGDGKLDDAEPLLEVIAEFDDPRIRYVGMTWLHRKLAQRRESPHWMTIIYGVNAARSRYAFLHDADAFLTSRDDVEHLYREIRNRGLDTLGVDARSDPFFRDIGYRIPGTWEMIVSLPWLRRFPPSMVQGRPARTPHGDHAFDTLLRPQYLDYEKGRIGVLDEPQRFVHFHGTIVTCRGYALARQAGVTLFDDEAFRLLLLSIFEQLGTHERLRRLLPRPQELARGLTDPGAPVRYQTEEAARTYPTFRAEVRRLCATSVFRGERAEAIERLLAPFDAHFAARRPEPRPGSAPEE